MLELPPELRNRVYRALLTSIENFTIPVNEGPPTEPALLSVCRQTREEAIGIYYQENTFGFDIDDFDISGFQRWWTTHKRYNPRFLWHLSPSPTWGTLLGWLEAYFKDELPGLSVDDQDRERYDSMTITGEILFTIVWRLKRHSWMRWEEVLAVLEDVHEILRLNTEDWA